MLDSLEGYLYNITAAAIQTVATGTSLAEFAASLAVSVDTVAQQQLEIKRLTEHSNALRKKGGEVTSGILNTGGNNSPNFKHCAAVGRSALHRSNKFYFDPRKNKDEMGWATKLMEAKEVVFNDE